MVQNAASENEFGQLMAELARGSEEAAWQIAHAYTPHVLRAVRRTLPSSIRSKLDSEDLAQMIWASLLLKGTDLAELHSPQQLINLLVRIARYKTVDAYRHYTTNQKRDHRRESPLSSLKPASSTGVDRQLLDQEPSPSHIVRFRDDWQHILKSLSERDREILRHRMNGETYAEIAQKAGVGITTVRNVLEHIVSCLRNE
jgi:RNA polymerase sigma factor (sigma-70 family)